MTQESDTQLGMTTRQILAAPKKSVYVAPGPTAVLYTRSLAAHLRRHDLRVVAAGWLANNWRGLKAHVVVDHGVYVDLLPSVQRLEWRRAMEWLDDQGLLVAQDHP